MARGCSIPTLVKAFTKYVQLCQRCPVSIKALFCIKIDSMTIRLLNSCTRIESCQFDLAWRKLESIIQSVLESNHVTTPAYLPITLQPRRTFSPPNEHEFIDDPIPGYNRYVDVMKGRICYGHSVPCIRQQKLFRENWQ